MALTEEQAKAVADALMSTEEGRAVLGELTSALVTLNKILTPVAWTKLNKALDDC